MRWKAGLGVEVVEGRFGGRGSGRQVWAGDASGGEAAGLVSPVCGGLDAEDQLRMPGRGRRFCVDQTGEVEGNGAQAVQVEVKRLGWSNSQLLNRSATFQQVLMEI